MDPEIMEMELKEEHNALMREHLWPYEPGPHLLPSFGSSAEKVEVDSRRSSYGSMKSARSMDHLADFKRAEKKKREDPPAKRREIRKLLEEHIALMRQIVSPLKPRPNIPRQIVSPYEPQPYISREALWSLEPDRKILRRPIPEKIRAGSPASSCGSMKSDRSMTLPVSVKPPASCESVKSDQSMGPPIAFKRKHLWPYEPGPHLLPRQIVSPYEPQPNISSSLTIPFTMSGAESENERAEEGTEDSLLRRWIMELQQKAGSPAPSCLSLKTDRSRTPPLNFRNEPGAPDRKDRGIDAGLWTQLNSMVSHLQEHISDCQNEMNMLKKFVRAINPEGQGEYEEGVKCESESAEKRQQRGIAEDHTGLPEKNESRGTGRLTTGQSSCCSGANVNPVTV